MSESSQVVAEFLRVELEEWEAEHMPADPIAPAFAAETVRPPARSR